MIGKITGRIDYRAPDHLLIDVRGVGYLVYCSDRTMAALPGVGEVKEWHRLLTSVQGVGAKASLAILGALGPDGVSRAIALGDWNAVKVAKGVGPKIAQRVVLDLKDKAPGVMAMTGSLAEAHGEVEAAAEVIETAAPKRRPVAPPNQSAQAEALSALGNLGYGPGDAAGAVAQAAGEMPEAETPQLIRAALKLLAPKG